MIKAKLKHYKDTDIYINPYTVSYITEENNQTIVGFTNGHSFMVTASPQELRRMIEHETKSLCKECTQCV